MAGLSPSAAHFFKFLLMLVLYTLAMTLYVSSVPSTSSQEAQTLIPEFPARHILQKRWYRYTSLSTYGVIPNDFCRLFPPSKFHTACVAMVAMALSSEI